MTRREARRRRALAAAFCWAAAVLVVARAAAQPVAPSPSIEELEAQRAEITAEIDAAAAGPGAASELLQELDRLVAERIAVVRRGQSAQTQVPDRAGQAPFSLREVDATARALAQAETVAQNAERALADAQAAVEASAGAAERAERQRRLAKEGRAAGRTSAEELRRAELESRVAGARLELHRSELRYWEQQHERARERVAELESELAHRRSDLAPDRSERQDILGEIDKATFDLERLQESQRYTVETAQRTLARAQAAYDAEPTPARSAELEAHRQTLLAEQRIATLLAERRARLEAERTLWNRRLRLLGDDVDRALSATWEDETAAAASDLEREQRLKQARVIELERERAALQQGTAGSALRAATLQRLIDAYREDLGRLEEHRFLTGQLQAALDERSDRLRLFDRMDGVWDFAAAAWRYELWESQDSPITVAKVFSALVVFGVGFFLARLVSRALGRRIFARLRRDQGAVHAFESLAFYVLLVLVFLTALRVVNIPLTAFAVVGGALAIGVGFGSQNVVSNFISGVILLAERPIKLGDLIEVGDVYGTVEQIGLRSTRIRTGDNIHIIVPNASFLESQVINWTHNDATVRVKIGVGIVYGSPTRTAERLIRQVLIDHPKVHETPEPIILFTDFGNDALIFEARFWVTVRAQMDRLRIESEVRFLIDDAFREAGITIAFPQRDVHLDTLQPLEVRMLDREET